MKKSDSDFLGECILVLIGFVLGIAVTAIVYTARIGTKIAYEDEYGNVYVVKVHSYIEDNSNNTITFEDNHNEVRNNIDNYVIIK